MVAGQPFVKLYYMRGTDPRWREKHARGRDIAV
jgi:hypothetical protein